MSNRLRRKLQVFAIAGEFARQNNIQTTWNEPNLSFLDPNRFEFIKPIFFHCTVFRSSLNPFFGYS